LFNKLFISKSCMIQKNLFLDGGTKSFVNNEACTEILRSLCLLFFRKHWKKKLVGEEFRIISVSVSKLIHFSYIQNEMNKNLSTIIKQEKENISNYVLSPQIYRKCKSNPN
jgi:hypothetical protein